MNILAESMTKLHWRGLAIRVWREETSIESAPDNKDLVEAVENSPSKLGNELAASILRVDRVNAVEILDSNGNGIVLYRDWP